MGFISSIEGNRNTKMCKLYFANLEIQNGFNRGLHIWMKFDCPGDDESREGQLVESDVLAS